MALSWRSSNPGSSASVPSRESSIPYCYKYDVFLSFRGEETRKGIISNLNYELRMARINTFKDDEILEIGMPISNILRGIEESRLVIVVLSSNYASSTWCLKELAHAFKCMEGKDRILPLFYNVDPSDVRKQRGSFAVALSHHEQNPTQDQNEVTQWRIALGKVGILSGWDARNFRSDRELVEDIVKFVSTKVTNENFSVGPFGSVKGGESFDDHIHSGVREVVMSYSPEFFVRYIKFEYVEADGHSVRSDTHGDPGYYDSDRVVTIKLDYPHEYLTSVQGRYEKVYFLCMTKIVLISFTTNRKTYGPYGSIYDEDNFSIQVPNCKIVGFHGRSSPFNGLRALGAHLKRIGG